MVSYRYNPIKGRIGSYTYNLVKNLQKMGIDVKVVSGTNEEGDITELSTSTDNSRILYNVSQKIRPDIVHIQLEDGLYGFNLNSFIPGKSTFSLESFYELSDIPIITTFHSSYTFTEWVNLVAPTKAIFQDHKPKIYFQLFKEYWKKIINYESYQNINRRLLNKSRAGIVLSKHLSTLLPHSNVIYQGVEHINNLDLNKKVARERLSLSQKDKIALCYGSLIDNKGLNIIKKVKIPDNWTILIQHSKNHRNNELIDINFGENKGKVILDNSYLTEDYLSLLFTASDLILFPYNTILDSDVMFKALGHGIPFLGSNTEFFNEFSKLNLGITAKRTAVGFSKGLKQLDQNYEYIKGHVDIFKKRLSWEYIAKEHLLIYNNLSPMQEIAR